MIEKFILNEDQKEYLYLYYNLEKKHLQMKLELVKYPDNNSLIPWTLCDGSRKLGRYYSNHVVAELLSKLEERIRYSDLSYFAKSGDKLSGLFYFESKPVNELIFQDDISYLKNPNVKEGARYFLQKQLDGSFKKLVILKP